MHLEKGMEFWTGMSCKAQKRSVGEADLETEDNLWQQKWRDVLLSVQKVM